jgi:uncharacterized repeat protein (TIGR01451 family)
MNRITAVTIAMVLCLALVPSAWAIGTPAGNRIVNQARADYTVGSSPTLTAYSGTEGMTVAELVDVDVSWADASTPVPVYGPLPTNGVPLTFLVSNLGNGDEDWDFVADNTVGGSFNPDLSPTSPLIYRDDGDGIFDTANLVAGTQSIQNNSTIYFFVVNDFGDTSLVDLDTADVSLTATSTHAAGGSVQPPPAGDNNSTLVLGINGGVGSDVGTYQVILTTLTMIKSSAVADSVSPAGDQPIPGATITYTIEFGVQGSGTAQGVVVTDPFPTDTTYVPGSLGVIPAPMGTAVGTTNVTINFGDLTSAAGTQTITFDVTID